MALADSGGHGYRLVLSWLTVVSWSQACVTLADSGGMVTGLCCPG